MLEKNLKDTNDPFIILEKQNIKNSIKNLLRLSP